MTTLIDNARVLEPGKGIVGASILIEAGKVAKIDPPDADARTIVDGKGRLLTPGLIDMHTHGFGLNLFEQGPQAMHDAFADLPRFGVTCLAPTLYTIMSREDLPRLQALAAALDQPGDGPAAAGFHLEGPFLKLPGAGASTFDGDVDLLEALLQAAGKVAAMSISPDTPGIEPVIQRLAEHRIPTFITHTRASTQQTERAIELGARHATHFYDVFPLPEETQPGVRPVGAVESILADPRVSVDFICDGIHVHPTAIRAALAAKGPEAVALITDAYMGAGLPPGIYTDPRGRSIQIQPNDAPRTYKPGQPGHNGLSGSGLTMNRGVGNLRKWLNLPDHAIWQMATRTPASILNLPGKGTLMPGADADLVLWDETDQLPTAAATWVAGRCVFDVSKSQNESQMESSQ